MKLLIDIDGVLADIHTPWLGAYNADYDDHLTLADITKWEMHEIVKPECGMKIYKYLENPQLYKRTLQIPGAFDGVNELRRLGDVVFVTAGFFVEKIEWLFENSFIAGDWRFSKDVIMCQDKSMIQGDWLIDDCPANIRGRQGLLFDQPWNRSVIAFRAIGWRDVVAKMQVTILPISAKW
jgi:5'(3')-deoxyribonucleotidase